MDFLSEFELYMIMYAYLSFLFNIKLTNIQTIA